MFQEQAPYSTHVYHLFIVETDRRDELMRHLAAAGIQTGIHYPVPIHLQPVYKELGYKRDDFPCAARIAQRILSLPMFPELQDEQVLHVVGSVKRFFG